MGNINLGRVTSQEKARFTSVFSFSVWLADELAQTLSSLLLATEMHSDIKLVNARVRPSNNPNKIPGSLVLIDEDQASSGTSAHRLDTWGMCTNAQEKNLRHRKSYHR